MNDVLTYRVFHSGMLLSGFLEYNKKKFTIALQYTGYIGIP